MVDKSDAIGTHIITLTQILDLTAAEPLQKELLAVRNQAVTLDAKNVERLGAQCLQVLLSASQTWEADDKPFSVSNASNVFQEDLNTFGIDTEIFTLQEST